MTRASFLIAIALSAAAAAQQPPPAQPLPADAAKAREQPKKKGKAKTAKKKAAPAALLLPGAAAPAAAAPPLKLPEMKIESKAQDKAPAPPPLPLPGLDAAPAQSAEKKAPPTLPLPLPEAPKAAPAQPPAATAQKAVPATAPAAPPKAAPAAGVKTLSAQGEKPAAAAPSGKPMAASIVQAGDLRLRPAYDSDLWNVRGFVGGERSSEGSYTDANSRSRLGLEATRWFSGRWLARGEIDWRASTQAYVPLHSPTRSPVAVDENRFDVIATIGYDLGPSMLTSGRLEFTPMLGVQYVGIRNQAFPSDLIGPDVGGRVRYALSTAVSAHLSLGYTFNLAVASVQNSALKSPKGDFNARAGLLLPLAGGFGLELDYVNDVLAFENTYRVAHGAALGFGTSF